MDVDVHLYPAGYTDADGLNLTMGQSRYNLSRRCSPASHYRIKLKNTTKLLSIDLLNVTIVLLLLCLNSIQAVEGIAFSSPVECTYASSTCTNCADVCTSNQFYYLIPSECHPLSVVSYQYL